MIKFITGNIFESKAEALINTVNTVGVMGKGIALQFKKEFSYNFKEYAKACKEGKIGIGKLFVTKDRNLDLGERIIINFPTKKHWKNPSEYSFIEEGLVDLKKVIEQYEIKSLAIPPLGAGNGGLHWSKVKEILIETLSDLSIDIEIYEPNASIVEKMKKERVKLTPARALMLYVLYDLVKHGQYVSEFSSEKVCYFLQEFGAREIFKLKYSPQYYGPYSAKVKYVLNTLNGSYIMGYSDMSKKPFDPLLLVADGYDEVVKTIEEDLQLKSIAEKTINFLRGYYSEFSLELLATIDYIMKTEKINDVESIQTKIMSWSERKASMFSNMHIQVGLKHLGNANFSN